MNIYVVLTEELAWTERISWELGGPTEYAPDYELIAADTRAKAKYIMWQHLANQRGSHVSLCGITEIPLMAIRKLASDVDTRAGVLSDLSWTRPYRDAADALGLAVPQRVAALETAVAGWEGR